MSTPDISQLTESQQTALQTYTSVTVQDPIAAIPILQRAEWNVQIAISRFFDGEPTPDPVAEARAAQSVPTPAARQTSNLQYESLIAANGYVQQHRSSENSVQRIDTTSASVAAYRPPVFLSILLTPFNILFRLFGAVFSPLSFLVPTFLSRVFRNLLSASTQSSRRQLPPADTARRFVREFEETYRPNNPLPFVETGFNLTLDKAKNEGKFLLVVLLSPSHDDTNTWVNETLLSTTLFQFLQSHQNEIVLWGGSVQDSEGYQVSSSLNCTKFPFAALICQTTDSAGGISQAGDMTVVVRATGPMPANELVAKLGTAITAQQAQLQAIRAQRAEQQASRNLRQEQDSAYERSLAQDRERARRRREEDEARIKAENEAQERAAHEEEQKQKRGHWRQWRARQISAEPASDVKDVIRVSIRLVDGERVIRRFKSDAPLEELYAFVECYDVEELEKAPTEPPEDYKHEYAFRMVSPMPRAVFDLETGGTIGGRVGRGGNLIVEPIQDDEEGEEEDD